MLHRNAIEKTPGSFMLSSQYARYIGSAILLCVGCTLLVACVTDDFCQEPDRPQLISQDNDSVVDRSFITDEPCQPPCWQSLVPGVSTGEEAEATLSKLPFVEHDSVLRYMLESYSGEFVKWTSSLSYASQVGTIRLDRNGILSLVQITLEYDLTLQEVIDKRGGPDFFEIRPIGPQCGNVVLYWLKGGYGLGTRLCRMAKNGQLTTPETLVKTVLYFSPVNNPKEYWMNIDLSSPEEAQNLSKGFFQWNGYASVNIDLVTKQ